MAMDVTLLRSGEAFSVSGGDTGLSGCVEGTGVVSGVTSELLSELLSGLGSGRSEAPGDGVEGEGFGVEDGASTGDGV